MKWSLPHSSVNSSLGAAGEERLNTTTRGLFSFKGHRRAADIWSSSPHWDANWRHEEWVREERDWSTCSLYLCVYCQYEMPGRLAVSPRGAFNFMCQYMYLLKPQLRLWLSSSLVLMSTPSKAQYVIHHLLMCKYKHQLLSGWQVEAFRGFFFQGNLLTGEERLSLLAPTQQQFTSSLLSEPGPQKLRFA